jgi:hypothetical protein
LRFLPRRPPFRVFVAIFLVNSNVEPSLKSRVGHIITDYFTDGSKPGILLYEERLREHIAGQDSPDRDLRNELQRAQRLVMSCLALEIQEIESQARWRRL